MPGKDWKIHEVKELIISAVMLTKSGDIVSFPGGNKKPQKTVALLIAILAPAQHELSILKSCTSCLAAVFFTKGEAVSQQPPEERFVLQLIFSYCQAWGQYKKEKKLIFASPGIKRPLRAEPFRCNKTCAC